MYMFLKWVRVHLGLSLLSLFDLLIGWAASKVRVLFFVYPSSFLALGALYTSCILLYIYTEESSMARPLGLSMRTQTFGC